MSTIPPNAPFSLQPNDLAQALPRPHNDPRSDPPHIYIHIYRICFTNACSPTHSPRAPAIGFAGPPTPLSSSLPSSLPPRIQAHIINVLCIPRGKYDIISTCCSASNRLQFDDLAQAPPDRVSTPWALLHVRAACIIV